jgi:hypothetical protein
MPDSSQQPASPAPPDSNSPVPIALTDTARVFATPDLFPLAVDPKRKSLTFIPMSRECYGKSSFLSSARIVRAGPETYCVEIDRLLGNPPAGPAAPSHYILHGAYGGSTLLARYLEELLGCFVLKEPGLLGQLSRLRISPSDSRFLDPRLWPSWFRLGLSLMARTYPCDKMVIVKPPDACNWMAPLLLEHDARTKLIFLLSPLKQFLASVLRADRNRRARARLVAEDLAIQWHRVPFLAPFQASAALSDGQTAAALWLFYNAICARLLARADRDRVLALNSEALFSRPQESLRQVVQFLELAPHEALADFAPLTRHAKGRDSHAPYDAAMRANELAEVEAHIGEELELALSWAKQISAGWQGPFPFD